MEMILHNLAHRIGTSILGIMFFIYAIIVIYISLLGVLFLFWFISELL